jgi:hypothetical protein
MWWTRPKTDAERREEITRLKRARDTMLTKALEHYEFQRIVWPIAYLFMLALFCISLFQHPERPNLATVIGGTAVFLVLGLLLGRTWFSPPVKGDRWGYSDHLGYEGDSPRDAQRKIDKLRAELGSDSDARQS